MLEKECVYNLRNRNVQRMLWPVDHEQLRIDIRNEQLKIKKEFTQKYNFDFDSEQPLCGRYHWELVESESPISSPLLITPPVASGSSTITTDGPSCSSYYTHSYDAGLKKGSRKTNNTMKDKNSYKNDNQNDRSSEKQKISRKASHSSRTSRYYESCTINKRSLRVRRKTSHSGRTIQ